MVLSAGRAALEMLAHPGKPGVGVRARDFELDVLIEEVEALLHM